MLILMLMLAKEGVVATPSFCCLLPIDSSRCYYDIGGVYGGTYWLDLFKLLPYVPLALVLV